MSMQIIPSSSHNTRVHLHIVMRYLNLFKAPVHTNNIRNGIGSICVYHNIPIWLYGRGRTNSTSTARMFETGNFVEILPLKYNILLLWWEKQVYIVYYNNIPTRQSSLLLSSGCKLGHVILEQTYERIRWQIQILINNVKYCVQARITCEYVIMWIAQSSTRLIYMTV